MAGGIQIAGIAKFGAAITALTDSMDSAARQIVTEGAAVIVRNARKQFTTVASSGTTERVLSPGSRLRKGEKISRHGRHVSGDRPHIRSGYLARSIQFDVPKKIGLGTWSTQVGPRAAYGRRIELGFRDADSLGRRYNQPAFPYLEPGLEASRSEIQSIVERVWRNADKVK